MARLIFLDYVKDRTYLLIFFLFSFFSVILFYYLKDPIHHEFLYPLSIGLLSLFLFLLIDGMKYYQFNKQIRLLLQNESVELRPYSKEQVMVKQLIQKINRQSHTTNSILMEQHKDRMTFLSHWMHHLKTPVSVIELIIDRPTNGVLDQNEINRLKQENKRLQTRIEQGLTVIRMERFENDLEIRPINIVDALRELINERKSEFIYRHVYPVMQCPQEQLYVRTDYKWNKILLDQIVSNAIKYSAGKGNKIIFSIEVENQFCVLSIKDEGIGISSYDMDRIFDPFFTGENGRKFRQSTGIGLYLCKKITNALGHPLSLHSQKDIGTTVEIRYLTKL